MPEGRRIGSPEIPKTVGDALRVYTDDDALDASIRENGGKVPGGEYIVYPVETSDRPWVAETPEQDALFLKNFYRALIEVRESSPDEDDERVRQVREFLGLDRSDPPQTA